MCKNEKEIPVKIINEQEYCEVDFAGIKKVCRQILTDAGFSKGRLEILMADNERIHQMNRQFLEHDYATDVISFEMSRKRGNLEGCIAVSAEMATERCEEYRWSAVEELTLYIIHGTLHLVGYDDEDPDDEEEMREQETHYLKTLGIRRK